MEVAFTVKARACDHECVRRIKRPRHPIVFDAHNAVGTVKKVDMITAWDIIQDNVDGDV